MARGTQAVVEGTEAQENAVTLNGEQVEATPVDTEQDAEHDVNATLADVIESLLSRRRAGGAKFSVLNAGEKDGTAQLIVVDKAASKNYAVSVKEIATLFG